MLMSNPEFKKNFILEVNATRLAACFGILILIYFSLYQDKGMSAPELDIFFNVTCGIGFFFVIIWGTYLTSSSIHDEVRQKTWDFVRMSSLSPTKILIGKLFGATSLVWIVGLIGILPVLLYSAADMIPVNQIVRPEATTLLVLCGCLLCWALLSHTMGMICSLHNLMQNRGTEKLSTVGITALVLFAGTSLGAAMIDSFQDFHRTYDMAKPKFDTWYGMTYFQLDLILLWLVFATFWAVVAAYRMLRDSLLFRDQPLAWIAFLITASFFLNGFTSDPEFKKFLVWPIVLSLITMALTAFYESRDVVKYKAMALRITNKQYVEAARYVPLWMISFVFLIISLICSIIFVDHQVSTVLMMLSLVSFVVRDLLVLHFLSWKPNIKRPFMACAFYGVVVYLLLPLIFIPISKEFGMFFFPLAPDKIRGLIGLTEGWLCFYAAFQLASIILATRLFKSRWNVAFKGEEKPMPPALTGQA